jgi:hypothetical protein
MTEADCPIFGLRPENDASLEIHHFGAMRQVSSMVSGIRSAPLPSLPASRCPRFSGCFAIGTVSVTSRYIHLAERQTNLQDCATAHLDPAPVIQLPKRREG